jgi:hypothetical protein
MEDTMSRTMLRCSLRMIGFAAILAAPMAWAQEAPPVRLRGTIERIDGAVYVVKARDGNELKVTLPEKPQIAGIVKASLSDIKQGSFVGVTAMPKADGSLSALCDYGEFLFAALHESGPGTGLLCQDVRDQGESWSVSGLSSDIGHSADPCGASSHTSRRR